MRKIQFVLLLITFGCNTQPNQSNPKLVSKSITKDKVVTVIQPNDTLNQQFFTKQDTGMIWNDVGDTLRYSKDEFNKIIREHSEFFCDYPQSPDIENACHANDPNSEFASEVGTDVYYMFYTFFIRKMHTDRKFPELRKKLTAAYSNINKLYQLVNRGGTYFGHMESKIPAFVEYSMKTYLDNEEYKYKSYDITKQKALFIQTLHQEVIDETRAQGNFQQNDIKEMNQLIASIEQSISDKFILNQSQDFKFNQY